MKKYVDKEYVFEVFKEYYNIKKLEKMFINTRKQEIVFLRHVLFYLLSKFTKLTYKKIGCVSVFFGRKTPHNHSSIVHSIKVINNTLFQGDAELEKDLRIMCELINNGRLKLLNKEDFFSNNKKIKDLSEKLEFLVSEIKDRDAKLNYYKIKIENQEEFVKNYNQLSMSRRESINFKLKTELNIQRKMDNQKPKEAVITRFTY